MTRHHVARVATGDGGVDDPRAGRVVPGPAGTAPIDAATLSHALATGITDAIRPALIVAAGFVTVGAFLSLLIPRHPSRGVEAAVPVAEAFASLEPIEEDRVLVDEREPA